MHPVEEFRGERQVLCVEAGSDHVGEAEHGDRRVGLRALHLGRRTVLLRVEQRLQIGVAGSGVRRGWRREDTYKVDAQWREVTLLVGWGCGDAKRRNQQRKEKYQRQKFSRRHGKDARAELLPTVRYHPTRAALRTREQTRERVSRVLARAEGFGEGEGPAHLLQMGPVEHLAVETDGAGTGSERLDHAIGVRDILGAGRERGVDHINLIGMNRYLAGEACAARSL